MIFNKQAASPDSITTPIRRKVSNISRNRLSLPGSSPNINGQGPIESFMKPRSNRFSFAMNRSTDNLSGENSISPSKRRISQTFSPNLQLGINQENNVQSSPKRSKSIDRDQSIVIAQIVATAVSQIQSEAQREIHDLRHKMELMERDIADKDALLNEQAKVLLELGTYASEFQKLHDQETAEREEKASTLSESFVEELKEKYTKELEDKDTKINSMKTQFEERRKEFITVIDDLHKEIQESAEAYNNEIVRLKTENERLRQPAYAVTSTNLNLTSSTSETTLHDGKILNNDSTLVDQLNELKNVVKDKTSKIQELEVNLYRTQLELENSAQASDSKMTKVEVDNALLKESEQLRLEMEREQQKRMSLEAKLESIEAMMGKMTLEPRFAPVQKNVRHSRNFSLPISASANGQTKSHPPPEYPLPHFKIENMSTLQPISTSYSSSSSAQNAVSHITAEAPNSHAEIGSAAQKVALVVARSPNSRRSSLSRAAEFIKGQWNPSISRSKSEERVSEKWCAICDSLGHESMECPNLTETEDIDNQKNMETENSQRNTL